MAESPNPEKAEPKRCEGQNCHTLNGVKYDQWLKKWLCNWCWAKTKPPGK